MPFLMRPITLLACLCFAIIDFAIQPPRPAAAAVIPIYVRADLEYLSLGYQARHGILGRKDPEKARHWYEESAKYGNSDAMFALGQLYSDGELLSPKYELARYWFGKAVALKHTAAMVALAELYNKGWGGPSPAPQAAFNLLEEASSLKNPKAMAALGEMYMEGRTVPQDRQKGFALYQQSAGLDEPTGQYDLATAYANGWGTPRDDKKALRFFKKAAGQDYAPAMLRLAERYLHGDHVPHDDEESLHWFTKAANHNSIEGLYGVIVFYEKGIGAKPNPNKVERRAEQLVHLKGPAILCDLAQNHLPDPTGASDYDHARHWYEVAASQNSQCAYIPLGNFYSLGQGVPQDEQKAHYWYQRACNAGLQEGCQRIGTTVPKP